MKDHLLLSALAVLLCASLSVAQAKSSKGEHVAKDLPCDIVFVKQVQTRSEVLYNTRFTPGGNLFVLRRDGTRHNLTRLNAGAVSDPDVSWDGKRILFSMMKDKTDWWHVYEIRTDGTGLRQLTFGNHDNIDACYLPNGQICFCSNRSGILNEYEMQRAELLHVMDADGSNVRQISFFLSGDNNPIVLQDGRVLWCRYEHHGRMDQFSLLATRPDGSDTEEFFGVKGPVQVFFESTQLPDGRVISTALRHFYTWEAGALVAIDPHRGPTDGLAPLNVTPGIPTDWGPSEDGRYRTPCAMADGSLLASWAPGPMTNMWGVGLARVRDPEENKRLAEIAKKKPDFGIWRLVWDESGTRLVRDRMLYNDPAFSDLDPQPLAPRPRPPVLPSRYRPEERFGEFVCLDVYNNTLADRALSPGKGGWSVRARVLDWDNKPIQRGDIKAVRVFEGLPIMAQGNTYRRISHYHHEPKRILGTAPVYPDGSFRVQVPTETPLHFQTLDAEGRALTTQLSWVYLIPGEASLCVGCHEDRDYAPTNLAPMALDHPPTVLDTPVAEREMFHFVRDIYPIFERHCVECHSGPTPAGEVDLSDDVSPTYNVCYETLRPWFRPGSTRASELTRMLTGKRDKGDCKLPPLTGEEFERLAKWIELGGLFRFNADGQVAKPFHLQDAVEKVDPILQRRGCMSSACHGEGNYTGAQWVTNFSRTFGDAGGGPIVPIEIAVNITHPERSRLLVAPRDKRPNGLTRPEREKALGLFEENCTSCHGADRSYKSDFDTPAQWQAGIEEACKKPKQTMSPPQIRLVTAWLAEFAGRHGRPTCPNIWTGPDDPDAQAILAFVEEASWKFVGHRDPVQAAAARCSTKSCHGAEKWRSEESRAMSPAQWKETIMRMVQKQWWGYRPRWGIRPPEAAIIHRYMLEQAGKAPRLPAATEGETAETLLEKARRLRFQGKIDEAEIACRQALALQPQSALDRRIRLELGVLFTQYGIPALTGEMRASRPKRELQY